MLEAGKTYRGVIGLDGGSTSSKCVFIDENENILKKVYTLSKGNPIQDMKDMFTEMRQWATDQGATLEVTGFGVTGYAGDVLERSLGADANIVETVAHMMSREALVPGGRRHLRHRRAGHQGDVHAERRREELPPVEQLLGR